jgi:hypothetical protein
MTPLSTYLPTHSHMGMETDLAAETLCFLECGTMDKYLNLDNPECSTPPSEPFRAHLC